MIRAVAIDDEPLALSVIESFCSESKDINLLKTFTQPKEGLKFINMFPVDLVFLDIQMPSMLGTDFVKLARHDVMVVFTTAFETYAIEGFNLNAIDYLIKPISKDRFLQAIEKAKKNQYSLHRMAVSERPYITIRADYSLIKIDLDRIVYVEGLDDYIKIHLLDSKPLVARLTLKIFLELLPEKSFVRVHRSYIVPIKKITALKSKSILLDKLEIPVGSTYENNLKGIF